MRSFRIIAPLALGASLLSLAVVPTAGASSSGVQPVVAERGPVAHASGGDAPPPPLPSFVQVRVDRAEAALERAAAHVDQGQSNLAVGELSSVATNMKKAWIAARYIVKNSVPADPEAEEPVVSPFATPEDTVAGVLTLQHDVVTTAIGLINGPDPALAPTIDTTITAALTGRDTIVNYIHTHQPAAPPEADAGGARAHASGDPIISTWDTVMQGAAAQIDDEVQHATGTRKTNPTSPIDLRSVSNRATTTQTTINGFWPPVPVED